MVLIIETCTLLSPLWERSVRLLSLPLFQIELFRDRPRLLEDMFCFLSLRLFEDNHIFTEVKTGLCGFLGHSGRVLGLGYSNLEKSFFESTWVWLFLSFCSPRSPIGLVSALEIWREACGSVFWADENAVGQCVPPRHDAVWCGAMLLPSHPCLSLKFCLHL